MHNREPANEWTSKLSWPNFTWLLADSDSPHLGLWPCTILILVLGSLTGYMLGHPHPALFPWKRDECWVVLGPGLRPGNRGDCPSAVDTCVGKANCDHSFMSWGLLSWLCMCVYVLGVTVSLHANISPHLQIDCASDGYFLRLSRRLCTAELRPAEVVILQEERRPCRASRISVDDSCKQGREGGSRIVPRQQQCCSVHS